jgi:alanine racemase
MDFISVEGERELICVMDDAQEAARHFGTICYEMTTALMPTIPRMLKEES